MPQTTIRKSRVGNLVIYNTYIGFFYASEEKLTSCQNDIDYYATLSFVKYEGEITFTKKVLSDSFMVIRITGVLKFAKNYCFIVIPRLVRPLLVQTLVECGDQSLELIRQTGSLPTTLHDAVRVVLCWGARLYAHQPCTQPTADVQLNTTTS